MDNTFPKIIVILGPTASGKTDLAIALARQFNGEVISADSRQIYKKMTIGTAKPLGAWERVGEKSVYLVSGIPHYMIDLIDPGDEMSVADFKAQALEHIQDITQRGRMPLLVGGTGLYIWTLVDNLMIPHIPPNKKLRHGFETKSLSELVALLQRIDPMAATQIDINNPRRVIRALEVAILSGESFVSQRQRGEPCVEALQLGVQWPLPELYQRIDRRVDEQIRAGLVDETQSLLKQQYGWKLPSMSSIGYREIQMYLGGECMLPEAIQKIKTATHQYAKRQMTWFKRDKRIEWLEGNNVDQADELITRFLVE